MDYSKMRFWSMGTVAAHKPLNSNVIEVFAQEQFPMTAGELTDNVQSITVSGNDSQGRDFEGSINTTVSVSAAWYPFGDPNRISAPDVRRDEKVMIWKYADSNDQYFWTTADEKSIRLLETVRHWYSGTTNENETEKNEENGYVTMISTHQKVVLFSTSKKNGEVVAFRVLFDTKNGTMTIQDDLGQEFSYDCLAGKIFISSENLIHIVTKLFHLQCEKLVVDASESIEFNTPIVKISDQLEVGGSTLLKSTSVMEGRSNFKGGIGGTDPGDLSSPIDFYGNIRHFGDWNSSGNIHADGLVSWEG